MKTEMPNYTKNTLTVKGSKEALLYFYNRNRVTEEDVENVGGHVSHLSFSKCVTRENDNVIMDYIQQNYQPKLGKKGGDIWDLSCWIWGTKWNTSEPSVDLSNIENGEIKYYFETAWCYPHNWLITVSKIFVKLEFEIIFTNEDDNYEWFYKYHFKEGKMTEIESYSHLERSISKYGMENLVDMMIAYLDEKEGKIANYHNRLQNLDKELEYMPWREYCTFYMETEDKENEYYERDLFMNILNGSEDLEHFVDEHGLYRQLFDSRELSLCFFKKIKEQI